MDSHWDMAREWDLHNEDSEEHNRPATTNALAGTYHCKSALRTHDSNMRLFLYKKSYSYLSSMSGSCGYNDEALLLLPDMWQCFYHKTHGLDRILCAHTSRTHSTGSLAFVRWADYTIKDITTGELLSSVLKAEDHIWGPQRARTESFLSRTFPAVLAKISRVLYLVYFLNLSLSVVNYRVNERRPDISVIIPGVVTRLEEDYYEVKYNDYLKVQIYMDGVRVQTPIFDQILQKDVYLTLCDKINERMNVVIGHTILSHTADAADPTGRHPDIHIGKVVDSVISWGDRLLYAERNLAFDLIAKFEAYCVSSILRHDNPLIWDKEEFQQNLLADDIASQPRLHAFSLQLCAILNPLDPVLLSEIHGLWRIWGHPIIDLEGGMKKMEATCLRQQNIDKKETAIGVRTFKLTFFSNYQKKHGHYPLCNATDPILQEAYSDHLQQDDREDQVKADLLYDPDSYVHSCIRNNRVINERDTRYRHMDWDNVVLYQCFQIPQSINLATMIKDKAISQTRSELVSSVTTRNSVFDSKKRRGVLKWLTEQTVRLKEFLRRIDRKGIEEDDRIIGLYPKERELKTKARFFSLMSYSMRMYITATEEILGTYLLPYFPMITMSDTLLNMIIRLYNMTTNIGVSGSKVTYSMNIDFSKWNQNMRERTNAGIFQAIDRIIGFRHLISRTHEIFKTSYLYLCSGEYVPQIIRGMLTTVSPYSRIGDESGKEGLRQKGWTITTVCDIISLAFLHNVEIELIGGGDNQVLTVTIKTYGRSQQLPPEEQMAKIQERMIRFRNALAKKMDKRGLPLKLEETWISHRLLMYNKIMYMDGVPLPGRLKIVSRLFSNSNEGIGTLGNITSTLGTGYQSLSSKDYDPLLAWQVSRVFTLINIAQYYLFSPVGGARRLDKQVLLSVSRVREGLTPFGDDREVRRPATLHYNEAFKSDRTLSLADLFLICLYYHKVLGGPGIGTPLSYIMKGFPDPLSEALAFNYSVLSKAPNGDMKTAIINLTMTEKSSVKHWEHLLEDPVSVNHDAPSHGVAALREQAERILKGAEIQNVRFKELISIGDTEYLREISEKLCQSDIIEPRLLHDIVGSTIPGYVNTILSKVDQSSTLNKLAADVDVITAVYESEIQYYIYLAKKIKVRRGHTITKCPTTDARTLRNVTWGKQIIGVSTPHPHAFLTLYTHSSNHSECDQSYISVLIKRPGPEWETKRGPFRPYFGSYTAEKFKTSVLASAYGDEDILKRAIKIQKLLGWRYQKGSHMYNLIQKILSCVTDADPDKFLPTIEEITGDVEHRYHDMATKHGGIPSNLIKYYTYASCNTSTFIDHSKGAANETLHFQAAIIYSSMMGILMSPAGRSSTTLVHMHEKCRECIIPTAHSEGGGEELGSLDLVSCPANDLMYIKEAEIPVHYHSHIAYLRHQEKLDNSASRGDGVMSCIEGRERPSWLVLLVASLFLGQKMKRSAVRLALSDLSNEEVAYVVHMLLCMSLLKKKRTLGSYDICDIEDLCRDYHPLVEDIASTVSVVTWLADMGYSPEGREDSLRVSMRMIIENRDHDMSSHMSSALGKYQDPEYSSTKSILLINMNPTLRTCLVCVIHASSYLGGEDLIPCGIHGLLKTTMNFHLYSFDRLSKNRGLSLPHMGAGSKRGRPSTLFDSIKLARNNTGVRLRRERKTSFIYNNIKPSEELMAVVRGEWMSASVSVDGSADTDPLHKGTEASVLAGSVDEIPSCISRPISLAQAWSSAMGVYLSDNRGTPMGEESPVKMAVEIEFNQDSVAIIPKALSLLSDYIMELSTRRVHITLMTDVKSGIEDTPLLYYKEIIARYHYLFAKRGAVTLVDRGDEVLNLVGTARWCDIAVCTSPGVVPFLLDCAEVHVITDSLNYYSCSSDVEESMKEAGESCSVTVSCPMRVVAFPYPIVLHVVATYKAKVMSDTLLTSFISENIPVLIKSACDDAISTVPVGSPDSVYRSLWLSLVRIKSGVVSSSAYEGIVGQLSAGLVEFALRSSRNERMPWRCSAIVRMIIALRILTSTEYARDLQYYTLMSSISYKPGTYRVILLHKGNIHRSRRGGLINWTKDSLGEKLVKTVEDMASWLSITWKSDHPLSRMLRI